MTEANICKRLKLTPEELKVLVNAAHATWNYIADDCMTLLKEEGKKKMPKSHVVEVVLDASYIQTNNPKLPPNVMAALNENRDYAALKAALWPHFYEEYV